MGAVSTTVATADGGAVDEQYFDTLYGGGDDPWGFRSRWYEARKRALLLACLPTAQLGAVFEPACANGELAAALALRCSALLASDFHQKAVDLARQRLAAQAHVRVEKRRLPEDWPPERFDLIVLGEIGYYLTAAQLATVAGQCLNSLAPGGRLLACHWRHPIEHCLLRGDEVHQLLGAHLGLAAELSHLERDFRIDVWRQGAAIDSSVEGRS